MRAWREMTWHYAYLILPVIVTFTLLTCSVDPRQYILQSETSRAVELPMCMDEQARERIRALFFEALDDALKDHVRLLMENWMKDNRSQPDRARVGTQNGIRAHQQARVLIQEWMPPLCSG